MICLTLLWSVSIDAKASESASSGTFGDISSVTGAVFVNTISNGFSYAVNSSITCTLDGDKGILLGNIYNTSGADRYTISFTLTAPAYQYTGGITFGIFGISGSPVVGIGKSATCGSSYYYLGTSASDAVLVSGGVIGPGVTYSGSVTLDCLDGTTPVYLYIRGSASKQREGSYTVTGTAISAFSLPLAGMITSNCEFPLSVKGITYTKVVGGDELLDETKKQTDIMEEQKETTKNIFEAIADFFGGFFDGIINAVKGLFIPEDGYFSDFFERLNDFFSEKLGVLYAPIDMFIDILTGVANAGTGDSGIPFPGIKVGEYVILAPQTVSISSILGDFPGLQEKVYFATDILMIGAVLWLLQGKLREVLKN